MPGILYAYSWFTVGILHFRTFRIRTLTWVISLTDYDRSSKLNCKIGKLALDCWVITHRVSDDGRPYNAIGSVRTSVRLFVRVTFDLDILHMYGS